MYLFLTIGVTWGTVAGFAGGKTDTIMMRIVDVLYGIPFIIFVILLMVIFGRNLILLFMAIGAVEWLTMARIVRSQVMSLSKQEFILAAEAMGVSKQNPREQIYNVQKGDTLWNISKKFRVSIEDVALWNELDIEKPLQINQEIKIFSRYERIRQDVPSRQLRTMLYPVKSGDTISRIASKFEISAQQIQDWNELEDVSRIFPGQVLKLYL